MRTDATPEMIHDAAVKSYAAFQQYKLFSLNKRAGFLKQIADEIENIREPLVTVANEETNLPLSRLNNELTRTIFQLTSYAKHCEEGNWLDARIDTADANRNPPKPDIRKMMFPLGPVVVFGASNFPFAYSTAGGDTACALAAGCPVIVKAHPAHIETSTLVADAIFKAAQKCNMPDGIFHHLNGSGIEVGEALIKHNLVKAVGFTGSFAGGKQLFDWGNQRKEPIPVFAEMGSVNPVFILPEKLNETPEAIVKMLADSIVLGVGQFCTNPGIIVAIKNDTLEKFIESLSSFIKTTAPAPMLHSGIFKNYEEKKNKAIAQNGVTVLSHSEKSFSENEAEAIITTTSAKDFLQNSLLQQEVFGPYSIIVQCEDDNEMIAVANSLKGQLTTTIIATENELASSEKLKNILQEKCGRFILNGVPTGVEVCLSMQHGGPFPATTDSRFTSVGADGIKRFARPVAFQNWPDKLLPEALQHKNSLSIWRMANGEWNNSSLK